MLKYHKNIGRIYISIRKMCSEAPDVLFHEENNKGIITLNRPKVLNAVDLSMVRKILPALKKWEMENKTCVIIKGAGGKAFCAGGDVRNIVEDNIKGGKKGYDFFREEYTMNGTIGTYKIPYIGLIHGVVMGGGVGLSVHGKYRVATEKSLFAMPETQIGFFPDVGGSYFLPRLQGKLGFYLALTGERLKGIDLLKAKIATHYTPSEQLPELEKSLLQCSNLSEIENTLNKYSTMNEKPFVLESNMDRINFCFNSTTIEEIVDKLEKDGSSWAQKTLETIHKMSPTSLKITLKILQVGSRLSLTEALKVEYQVATRLMSHHDFHEGVRALLIDKDQKPKWNPSKITDVKDDIVDSYFTKLPEDEELKHIM